MHFRQARGQAARLSFLPRNRKNAGLLYRPAFLSCREWEREK